ncbi:MAG: TnpV protein [Anaerovoracaceae bacterium]
MRGNHYTPCLVLSDAEERPIGIWCRKHLDYIKRYHPILYTNLVLNCKLHSYLTDIDIQTQDRLALLIK